MMGPFAGIGDTLNYATIKPLISTIFMGFAQQGMVWAPIVDDIILYTEDNFPISLSLKTSMRERYKQADLEAVALKYVHRRAKSYLINLSETETRTRKQDINKGNIMGLNDFILATDTEFDDLVFNLKKQKYIIPEKIEIITSSVIIRK